jgi:hypothetical protein
VSKAAKALKNPKTASGSTIKRMATIVLDDQEYDPKPHGQTRGRTARKASKKK